jgi:hypothetical protein
LLLGRSQNQKVTLEAALRPALRWMLLNFAHDLAFHRDQSAFPSGVKGHLACACALLGHRDTAGA